MSGQRPSLLALALPAALIVAYDGLAHYVSTFPDAAGWAAGITLLPALALGLGLLARHADTLVALLAGLVVAILAAVLWPEQQKLGEHLSALYLAQYLGTNLALALFFGRTLLAGRTPACTTFASVLQPVLSPRMTRYTRQVTVAWTAFFVLTAATSTLLYIFAPAAIWSAFSNLFYLPSVALMFIVEGLIRRLVLPPEERHGIVESIRAYTASTRSGNPIRQ